MIKTKRKNSNGKEIPISTKAIIIGVISLISFGLAMWISRFIPEPYTVESGELLITYDDYRYQIWSEFSQTYSDQLEIPLRHTCGQPLVLAIPGYDWVWQIEEVLTGLDIAGCAGTFEGAIFEFTVYEDGKLEITPSREVTLIRDIDPLWLVDATEYQINPLNQ